MNKSDKEMYIRFAVFAPIFIALCAGFIWMLDTGDKQKFEEHWNRRNTLYLPLVESMDKWYVSYRAGMDSKAGSVSPTTMPSNDSRSMFGATTTSASLPSAANPAFCKLVVGPHARVLFDHENYRPCQCKSGIIEISGRDLDDPASYVLSSYSVVAIIEAYDSYVTSNGYDVTVQETTVSGPFKSKQTHDEHRSDRRTCAKVNVTVVDRRSMEIIATRRFESPHHWWTENTGTKVESGCYQLYEVDNWIADLLRTTH